MIDIKIPDISTLRRIRAISRLSESQLIVLANQLRILTAKRKELLLKAGSTDTSCLYIIKGRVLQSAIDGKKMEIAVNGNDEMKPIAQLRPSIYDVTALESVSYLKIDRKILTDFTQLSDVGSTDISVHSLFSDTDDEDNSIVNHLYRNLMDNSIKLPELPSVAARVQKIYSGKSTEVDAIVKILISYPDLSRKIKNVARCPRDNNWSVREKIQYSVERLGVRPVYCIVMIYAIGKLVSRMPETHLQRVASFWQHSLNVAAISRVLAKVTKSFPPDLAMLAGLIHGIGVLVIDDRLLEHHHLMLDHLEIDHAIQ
ncbi:MAG: HDOD domain-containing protein, partial [Gammaproteobacteria bacterium]|nr:HDOD domain-containing protein [Gammaproteobacteria bacterium]